MKNKFREIQDKTYKDFCIVFLLFLLSSCSSTIDRIAHIGQNPEVTDVNPPVIYSSRNMNNVAQKNYNSLWQQGALTFFEDQRARTVGDIVKVQINLNENATLANSAVTSRKNNEDFAINSFFGLDKKIPKALPGATNPYVGTTSGNNISGNGTITRSEVIKTTIAAMVVQIMPTGNLLIRGSQEIMVNNEIRVIAISGIVRGEDINSDNTILSEQIAEARISYGGKGSLSNVVKPRYGSEIIDSILPW
jgi:flagellar L-ring protein precursor FlgH